MGSYAANWWIPKGMLVWGANPSPSPPNPAFASPRPTSEEPTVRCNAVTALVGWYGVEVDEGSGASMTTRNTVWNTNNAPAIPRGHREDEALVGPGSSADLRSTSANAPKATNPTKIDAVGHTKLSARTRASWVERLPLPTSQTTPSSTAIVPQAPSAQRRA